MAFTEPPKMLILGGSVADVGQPDFLLLACCHRRRDRGRHAADRQAVQSDRQGPGVDRADEDPGSDSV